MAVDLNELLVGAQARGLERMANGFDQDARLLSNVATKKFDQVDLVEAAAAKELSKAGMGSDVAGLNTAAGTPSTPSKPG